MTYDLKKKIYLNEKYGSKLPMKVIKRVLKDVLNGLAYLHDSGIVHRDIKPANILLTLGGVAKLADFGVSQEVDVDENGRAMIRGSSDSTGVIGTFLFLPYEAFFSTHFDGFSADIWALGVTLFIFLCGKPPLMETNEHKFMKAMKKANVPTYPRAIQGYGQKVPWMSGFLQKVGLPGPVPAFDLLAKMLNKMEPASRPSAAELLTAPFITGDE